MYVKFIDRGPRPAGTQQLENAIDHMIALAKAHGLTNITTEEVDVFRYIREQETLKLITPFPKDMQILGLMPNVNTPPGGLVAEGIVVKNFDELEQLEPSKVKGKIVIYNQDWVSYDETVLYRVYGASIAAMKGAVAALIRSVTDFSIYSPHTGSQEYLENVTKIPAACITQEDAELLSRFYNRGQLITLELNLLSSAHDKKSRNVLIDIRGTTKPEKQVIVSGHTDSWDVGMGATDDGGGMFISWFVPVILHKLNKTPKRTLRAILWTGEEQMYKGAYAYLDKHRNQLDDINFIMEADEGTAKPLSLEVSGSFETECLIAEILDLFESNKIKTKKAAGSDITVFTGIGIPGASLLNQNDKYFWFHHTAGDTLDAQNKTDLIESAAFWAAVSYVIADITDDMPR